jgi:uncharacterized membrane protein
MHSQSAIVFIFIGLLYLGLSIPLILRRIPPNDFYGYRVPKTLNNPNLWYNANEFMGKCLAIAGIVIAVTAELLARLKLPNFGHGPEFTYTMLMLLILSVSASIALIFSMAYVRKL